MVTKYGKLIQLNPNGPEQEFELAKTSISLGRGTTNDITLDDVRVSRSHARLDIAAGEVTLLDLGSSNGTRVNGFLVERATLAPETSYLAIVTTDEDEEPRFIERASVPYWKKLNVADFSDDSIAF